MELFLQTEVLLALALVAVIAGFLDTLAGGGGLIVIPALLLAQVPPVAAIATNKLQGTFGTFTAALTMVRKKLVTPRLIRRGFILAFAGSVAGAVTIQHIPAAMVKVIVPMVLTAIALYFLVSRDRGDRAATPCMEGEKYDVTVVPAVGFYDGAFGPGAGSFYTCLLYTSPSPRD